MNEQLIKFIELCLTDGVISDKEHQVILKKAKELGVDKDECEIIIESLTQKSETSLTPVEKISSKHPKRNFKPKVVKSIKPAELNKEKEFNNKITEINSLCDEIEVEKNSIISEINKSNDKIITEGEGLREDLDSSRKVIYEDYKNLIDSFIKSVEDKISKKFGKSSISFEDNFKKYKYSYINNLSIFFDQSVAEFSKVEVPEGSSVWTSSKSRSRLRFWGRFHLLITIIMIISYWMDKLDGGFSVAPPMFYVITGVIFLFLSFGRFGKRDSNPTNFKQSDVDLFTSETIKMFSEKINDFIERRKLIERKERLIERTVLSTNGVPYPEDYYLVQVLIVWLSNFLQERELEYIRLEKRKARKSIEDYKNKDHGVTQFIERLEEEVDRFEKEEGKDIRKDPEVMNKLKKCVKKAIFELSNSPQTESVTIDLWMVPIHVTKSTILLRSEFEKFKNDRF